jgi:branched-chain amino acid transport system permease protein
MNIAIEILVSGLTLGAMYAISSISLSLLWGTLGVLNMAQGAFLVIGGYAAFTGATQLGLPAPLTILFTIVVGAITGLITYFGLVRHLMNRPGFETAVIIGTFGLSLMVQNLVLRTYGAYPFSQPLVVSGGFNIARSYIPYQNVVILFASVLVMIVLALALNRTRMGRAIRATAQNGAAAQLMGVPVGRIFLQVFLIAGVLAAISGTMLSSITTLSPTMGYDPMLKAFIVCVVAGLGNVYGALAASFMIGLIEASVEFFLGVKFGFPMLLLLIILTLIWRPAGIFGQSAVARQ